MLKCGFYEKDITPPLGCNIYGYFTPRVAETVKDALYSRALVLENGENTIAMVTVDALNIPKGLCEAVTKRVEKYIGLKWDNIMISATHAHTSGPVHRVSNSNINLTEGMNEELNCAYLDMLNVQVADSIILAYQHLREAEVSYAKGYVDAISMVRNFKMKDGTVRTNPPQGDLNIIEPYSDIDTNLPVLFFKDLEGKMIGALINFACHHDCVHGSGYSSDYSGVLSNELKKIYGPCFSVMFINGFCGNINNLRLENPQNSDYRVMGKILADEVIKIEKKAVRLSDDTIFSVKEMMKIPRRKIDPTIIEEALELRSGPPITTGSATISAPEGGGRIKYMFAPTILREYYDKKENEYLIYLQAIRIGDCILYALPGEVFAQFGEYIKQNSPTAKNFLAEMSNTHNNPYVPIREFYQFSTVYETAPVSSYFDPDAGYIMSEKAVELGKRLMKTNFK